MELQQIFMANMKKRRKQLGLTQEKLAERCITDPGYIRQIEIGRRFPSIKYIERIAKSLDIAPYLLFYEENDTINEETVIMPEKQKQKLKSLLKDNISQICSIIDKEY